MSGCLHRMFTPGLGQVPRQDLGVRRCGGSLRRTRLALASAPALAQRPYEAAGRRTDPGRVRVGIEPVLGAPGPVAVGEALVLHDAGGCEEDADHVESGCDGQADTVKGVSQRALLVAGRPVPQLRGVEQHRADVRRAGGGWPRGRCRSRTRRGSGRPRRPRRTARGTSSGAS